MGNVADPALLSVFNSPMTVAGYDRARDGLLFFRVHVSVNHQDQGMTIGAEVASSNSQHRTAVCNAAFKNAAFSYTR